MRTSLNSSKLPKILAIGVTSREIVTGVSIAFDNFIQGLRESSIPHCVVDAGVGISVKRAGVFSIHRMLGVLGILAKYFYHLRFSDIVYVTIGCSKFGFLRDFIIIHISAIFNRRIVLHLHGGGYHEFYQKNIQLVQRIIRQTLSRVDTIIVLGDLLRDQFKFLSTEYGPEIVVVPNGLPGEDFPLQTLKKLPDKEPLRLLFLSNMIPSKGYLQVLEACRILKSRQKSFINCDFAGEFMSTGSSIDKVEPDRARKHFCRLTKKYGLNNTVYYHGSVKNNKKQDLISHAHIFLLPTQYSGEGQPISIIEALSQGVPVIATRFRGIPEQIEDGENGILLDSPTPNNIADAIDLIISNCENYQRMSRRAYEIFKERFTRSQYIERLTAAVLGSNQN